MDLTFKTTSGVASVKPVSPEGLKYLQDNYGAGKAGVAMDEKNLMPFSVTAMNNGLNLQAEGQ